MEGQGPLTPEQWCQKDIAQSTATYVLEVAAALEATQIEDTAPLMEEFGDLLFSGIKELFNATGIVSSKSRAA